jgi:uncharacterized protein YcbX
MTGRIAGLFIYPVKSAAGIACDQAMLGERGLEHDREWMIVDAAGRFVTQREEPRLALLGVALEAGRLQLSNPRGAGPCLALDHEGELREVGVWRSRCHAFDAGDEAAQFLSDWLGRSLRLVRFDPRRPRFSNPDWTGGRQVPNAFSDGYPLLVLSRASVDDLSARVGRPLPVQRFRPNLLLDGIAAYAEDTAAELLIGDVRLAVTKACTRCAITTVDPARGERDGQEPLATLKSYRYDPALRGVVFGRNAYALAGAGARLARGMPVQLRAA